ncbi:MAG: hypothetical protein GKS06_09805 [Acidobacteria bacterium]|nr:hypothetical protein [Acidobacteriota bacterium]
MEAASVESIGFNNRRRLFEVRISGRDRDYSIPFGLAKVDGLVASAEIDAETGGAGFCWRTRGGGGGAMLAEEVLWIHHDPEVRHDQLLYELTLEALKRKDAVAVGIRALAATLGTSPARVQMLLRPTVYKGKSIKAMLALLSALGADVDLRIYDRNTVA